MADVEKLVGSESPLEVGQKINEIIEKGVGGTGYVMFDTIYKDHILTYEESKGLALQGTYVYKEAIAGSRYGYPDFYAKCLEEYENSSSIDWEQPILTASGTLGGNSFAVSGTQTTTDYALYHAFDNNSATDWVSASANENLIIYNPVPIKITRIDVTNRNSSTVRYIKSGTIYGSNDNSQYTEITTFTNSVTTQLGEWSIDLSSNTNHYKYYKLSMVGETYCSANQITITASEIVYKNPNGHLFYDISQKDQIDEVFASTGMAWMYGIDQENERIFLPRNNYFEQLTADVSEVGQSVEAGLPAHTHQLTMDSGYGGNSGGSNTRFEGGDRTNGTTTATTKGASNAIYGKSNTVQPNAVKKLLYICVGNTVADTSWVDVVTQVEEGVKDIEDAKDEAIDAMKSVVGGTVPLGFIGSAILGIDETLNLQRYLNGQIILQDQFKGFTKFLKRRVELYPSLACIEEEWQTEVTMSAFSQCGKFVIDDNAGTIRLPRVINIQGLTDLSKLAEIVEAGLPNITGYSRFNNGDTPCYIGAANTTGAFYENSKQSLDVPQSTGTNRNVAPLGFDASLSNPIYGNSNTVQQEQIQYPYFIQVATGAETEDNIINEIELNNPFSLLDYKFSEYELNNISWLRSNGQYNAKAVYPAVYDLLLKIYNGTETKAGVSVKLNTEEFTDYDFVLNTADETFRLPIKVANSPMGGTAPVLAGSKINDFDKGLSWRNDDGSKFNSANTILYVYGQGSTTNGVYCSGTGVGGGTGDTVYQVLAPANLYAKLSDATNDKLKLYFYVGETVQNANLINAGRIEEQLGNKLNRSEVKAYIVDTYVNGTSWYRIYSDGWCEQGGGSASSSNDGHRTTTVTLLKPFIDTNYSISVTTSFNVQTSDGTSYYHTVTKTGFKACICGYGYSWRASGYIA